MNRTFRSNRSTISVATAATAAAFSMVGSKTVYADAPIFDNFSSYYYGVPAQGPNASGHYFAPDLSGVFRAPDSTIGGTSKGDAYVLPAGTTELTGIDSAFVNETDSYIFNGNNATGTIYPQSGNTTGVPGTGNGTGTTYDNVKLTVSIWGQVNNPGTPHNYNNSAANVAADSYNNIGGQYVGSINSSNQAFSDLLATETYFVDLTSAGGLPPGYIEYLAGDFAGLGGVSPGLSFGVFNRTTGTVIGYNNANGITTGPVNVTGLSSVGLSYDVQGSTDGGLTYKHIAGLVPEVVVDTPTNVGATVTNGAYTNFSGETNGNYSEGPYYYTYNNSGTTTTIPDEGVLGRVFGIAPGVIYNWNNATSADADFSDSTQWNPNGVPGGNDTAVFNLGSTAGYSVQISDFETAYNLNVLNDNVAFDLNAEASELYVQNVMSVGLATSTSGTHYASTLTLENTNGNYIGFMRPNALTIGGNGSTGTVIVSAGVYLGVDNSITINAGSKLIVQKFAKVDADTLFLAGTTNAWTGQLDIGYDSTQLFDGDLPTVTNQLKQGFNGGKWNGNGIISSAAAADTTHLTAIGAILNNDGNGNPIYSNTSTGGLGVFDGDNPGLTVLLLRYTYYGDANLDGTVDGSDYSRIDNGFLNHLTGWYNGDFNYDGVVNGSDYTLADNAYNQQYGPVFEDIFDTNGANVDKVGSAAGGPDDSLLHGSNEADFALNADPNVSVSILTLIAAPPASAAVPEPATLGLLAMASLSVLSRRSRRSAR